MTQDVHALGSSFSKNSGGGVGGDNNDDGVTGNNESSKKSNTPEKIPQRIFGIAELEAIKLEKLRKKLAADAQSGNSSNIRNDPSSSSTVRRTDIRPDHASTWRNSSIPAPNNSFISASLSRGVEIRRQVPILTENQLNFAGFETSNHGNTGKMPKCQSGFHNLERDTSHLGFRFMQPHQTSIPLLPFHGVPQRQNHVQQPFTTATGNVYWGISPEFLLHSQVEPPSNKYFLGSSYTPSLSAIDETVGNKRMYPFNPETSSTLYVRSSFRPAFSAPGSSSDDLTSNHEGHEISHVETRNKDLREGRSSSSHLPKPNPSKYAKLNGALLTVAPPSVSPLPVISKDKISIDYSSVSKSQSQEHVTGQAQQLGPSQSTAQPFGLFSAELKEDQSTSDLRNDDNGEKGDMIDLNLSL